MESVLCITRKGEILDLSKPGKIMMAGEPIT